MIIFLVLFCLLQVSSSHFSLKVIHQEIVLPHEDEIAIRFRVDVRNNGLNSLKNVALRFDKCCFYESSAKVCQLFHPIGEKVDVLKPNKTHSLAIVYVNNYIFNRVGECNGTLHHDSTLVKNIYFGLFNTTSYGSFQWIPGIIRVWLTGMMKCYTFDQDPLRNCQPVNCIYKYDGRRNHFDRTTQMCTESEQCTSEPKSSLFGNKLNVVTNTCERLESNLTEADIAALQYLDIEFMDSSYNVKNVKEVICVHGTLTPNNRSCKCDFGWFSDPHDRSPYDPITQVYYLCNTHGYLTPSKLKKITATMIKILIYLVIIMLCCCIVCFVLFGCARLWIIYRTERGRKATSTWLRRKLGVDDEEAKEPLVSSNANNHLKSSPPQVQHIDTSWYSTEDTIYDKAVVHTESRGNPQAGELYLYPGDVITDLEKLHLPGYWKGTCKERRGMFPVACAEFVRAGQRRSSLPKDSLRR